MTFILGMILMYFFTIFGFLFFRNQFKGERDVLECESMLTCFAVTVNEGLRAGGGLGDYLTPQNILDPYFVSRTFYDLTFFLVKELYIFQYCLKSVLSFLAITLLFALMIRVQVISVILLNIIFGIILDTFAGV